MAAEQHSFAEQRAGRMLRRSNAASPISHWAAREQAPGPPPPRLERRADDRDNRVKSESPRVPRRPPCAKPPLPCCSSCWRPPRGAQDAPQATDLTSADIQKFLNALPRDAVSDRPIRVVEVTGDYRVGVYGVFRPQSPLGGANLHQVNTTEIYYMVEGWRRW